MSRVDAGPLAQVFDTRLQASMARSRASSSVAPQTTGEEVSLLGSCRLREQDGGPEREDQRQIKSAPHAANAPSPAPR
jgi:hypothetical protein